MKKFVIILSLITLSVFVSGAVFPRKFKAGIIFNNVPFTPETAGAYKRNFKKGERIYWLFMSKKPIKAQFIKVQIVSSSNKQHWYTYTGIVYTHDYRINADSPHYFTDYFVMHSGGHYFMEIFDRNNLYDPITVADFYVN